MPAQPTNEETMATYLYAMGLSLVVLLSAFVHNHGFLQAQEIGEGLHVNIVLVQ